MSMTNRHLILLLLTVTVAVVCVASMPGAAQTTSEYRLVPGWPTLPAGMYFGSKTERPKSPDTTRSPEGLRIGREMLDRLNAAPQGPIPAAAPRPGDPDEGSGVSGLAIDAQDHIYMFNRGKKPVLIFDRDGKLLKAGGDFEMNGRKIDSAGLHSGGVDSEGNIYVADHNNARVVKMNPAMDKLLLQIGTTGVTGHDATHLDKPSGVAIQRNGNIVITDGYGNNRLLLYDKNGKFIKQSSKGAGGPQDKGNGPGEFHLPHKVALDAQDNIYAIDRENYRIQIFDKDMKYLREISQPGWNPWDVAVSPKGDIGYVPDHTTEQVIKFSMKDGSVLARWGKPGRGPGEFDWVHGVVVDSQGSVYVCDTYGQHVQKFVPAGAAGTAQRP